MPYAYKHLSTPPPVNWYQGTPNIPGSRWRIMKRMSPGHQNWEVENKSVDEETMLQYMYLNDEFGYSKYHGLRIPGS